MSTVRKLSATGERSLSHSQLRSRWSALQTAKAFEVPCAISTDLMTFARRAAVEGLGIAMLPEMFAGGAIEKLTRVLPVYRRPGSALSVVTPSRGFEPRAVALFKEGLIEELTRLTSTRCASPEQLLRARSRGRSRAVVSPRAS